MSDEQLRDLIGRAADVVNTNEEALTDFRFARGLADDGVNAQYVSYDLVQTAETLSSKLASGNPYNVGWWYGRLTDPRRPWHARIRALIST